MSSENPLAVSMAVLKVNWDRRRQDFIENFVPFVIEGLRIMPGEQVSLLEINDVLHREFGLSIPLGPLRTILKRLERRSLLSIDSGVYVVNRDLFPADDLSAARSAGMRTYRSTIDKYIEFCDRLGREVSRADGEAAINTFVDRYSIPFLQSAVEGPAEANAARTVSDEYLIGAFVVDAQERDSDCFTFLVEIAKGAMLAEAIYVPDANAVARHFRGARVYLDTTFLIRALGYSGPHLESPYRLLVDGLRETGAKPRCFKVTLKEATGILYANAMRMQGGGWRAYGETVDHFRQAGLQSSDVMLLCENLETALSDIGVFVEERPPFVPALTLDEKRLEEILAQEVGYSNQDALIHDLNVLTAIYRARNGVFPRFIEDCEALLVTTNNRLVLAMRIFMREAFSGEALGVPLAIGDHAMGTVVWLKKPIEMPDLPMERIIADCHAALNPPHALWKLYFEELDRLIARGAITAEDHAFLRSQDAEQALMDLTLGDANAFVEGTVEEVLARARQNMQQDASTEQRRAEAELQDESRARLAAEQTHAGTKKSVRRQAERIAKWIGWVLKGGALAVLGVAAALALPRPISTVGDHLPGLIAAGLLAVLAIAGVIDLVFGKTLHGWVSEVERRVANRVFSSMVQDPGPQNGNESTKQSEPTPKV